MYRKYQVKKYLKYYFVSCEAFRKIKILNLKNKNSKFEKGKF